MQTTEDFLKLASDRRKEELSRLNRNRTSIPESQMDLKTEIRAAALSLLLACDADVESSAERFTGWWTNQRVVHCRQAANGELNPPLQPS